MIHFPIVHTPADMGALQEQVQHATLQKLGVKGWRHKRRAVDRMWSEIEAIVRELPLSFAQVRLYQDGLPVCGQELAIVAKLARQGSRNHQLLLYLVQQGATLVGTESPELLLQEYAAIKDQLPPSASRGATPASNPKGKRPPPAVLLDQRNRFIAQRINTTLKPGETGILFLGMLHHIERLLDRDIEVIYPLGQPSGKVT